MKAVKNLCSVLSLLAIAGLWTECANDETVEVPAGKQAISFRVQGSLPALRATGTTINYVNAFVVNAYGDVTGEASFLPSPKTTMGATTVYRIEGTSNVFDYNPKAFYYAEDASVGFSAYSPVSKNVSDGLGVTGADNRITYTVLPPDDTNGDTKQEDLLVAFTKQNNLDGSSVSLDFKHALSRVYVKAKNTMSENVIIESIKLVNLYNKGTLDIDDDAWATTANTVNINDVYVTSPSAFAEYKVLWTPSGSQDNTYTYALPASGVAVPGTTTPASAQPVFVVSMEQGMLILPQTTINENDDNIADANDFYLEIKYKVANIKETAKIPFKDINNISPSNDEGLTFEFGRQYALNISFDNKEIGFTVTVEAWETPIIEP